MTDVDGACTTSPLGVDGGRAPPELRTTVWGEADDAAIADCDGDVCAEAFDDLGTPETASGAGGVAGLDEPWADVGFDDDEFGVDAEPAPVSGSAIATVGVVAAAAARPRVTAATATGPDSAPQRPIPPPRA